MHATVPLKIFLQYAKTTLECRYISIKKLNNDNLHLFTQITGFAASDNCCGRKITNYVQITGLPKF